MHLREIKKYICPQVFFFQYSGALSKFSLHNFLLMHQFSHPTLWCTASSLKSNKDLPICKTAFQNHKFCFCTWFCLRFFYSFFAAVKSLWGWLVGRGWYLADAKNRPNYHS